MGEDGTSRLDALERANADKAIVEKKKGEEVELRRPNTDSLASTELGLPEGTVKDVKRRVFGARRSKDEGKDPRPTPKLMIEVFKIIDEECDDPEARRAERECFRQCLPYIFRSTDRGLDEVDNS
jgi:hypothetical protein